jgi:hypothetical protein
MANPVAPSSTPTRTGQPPVDREEAWLTGLKLGLAPGFPTLTGILTEFKLDWYTKSKLIHTERSGQEAD